MRFRKPVIVSDIAGSGVGWVVRAAGHGLLVPTNDPVALAVALRQMQCGSKLRQQLGRAGSIALTEQFDIQPVAAKVSALYRQVLIHR